MSRWPKWLPHPALVFVVLAWGLNFVVVKMALDEWTVRAVMLLRYLTMAPILYVYARSTRQLYWPERRDWPKFLLAGCMGSGIYMILFLEGMARVGAAQGAVCLATAPLWVSIFAVLIGQESARWNLFAGGVIAYTGVAGVILLGTGPLHWTPLGLTLTLLSAVVWAVSVVQMKSILGDRPAVGVFLASYPGAALVLIPYGIKDVLHTNYAALSPVAWFTWAYLAFVAGAGAFTAYYIGVREVGPAKTSMIAYFVPIVAAISAWALLGEQFTGLQALAVGIVLAGVILANRKIPARAIPASEQVP